MTWEDHIDLLIKISLEDKVSREKFKSSLKVVYVLRRHSDANLWKIVNNYTIYFERKDTIHRIYVKPNGGVFISFCDKSGQTFNWPKHKMRFRRLVR